MNDAGPSCTSIRSTCPYCGVGCGITASLETGEQGVQLKGISGDLLHPANQGRLCAKGSALGESMGLEGRLLHPRVSACRTDWNTAMDVVAQGFRQALQEHGPDSVAFYLSGQLLTEDYYVANKLMKGFMGSANVDTNSRLCMASAVSAYKRAFGEDVVPCDYEDIDACQLLVLAGSNAAWAHPVLYQRMVAARRANPQMRVVVIDPRRTASCELADLHLPLKPGSDGFLFTGLLAYLADHDFLDRAFLDQRVEGLDQALGTAPSLAQVVEATGLEPAQLLCFYRWFADSPAPLSFYSQGINQSASGTDKANAIINCHLATGKLGRPGMGPFSITGQPNAMGGREVGGLANQLAAHRDFSPEQVGLVEAFWQAPNMARGEGLKAVEMFQAMADGRIKAVWIMGTNPMVSLPSQARVREALARCELVVVSDCVAETDTTALAHVLLPASGWGEKSGTVTNSERCISRQRSLLAPPGEARHDWQIICDLAQRLGYGGDFDYESPADIFREHARLSGIGREGESPQTPCFDISVLAGLSDEAYEALVPLQWPLAADGSSRRPFQQGRFSTPSGRARMLPVRPVLPAGERSQVRSLGQPSAIDRKREGHSPSVLDGPHRRGFILNSGRLRDQWHSMTRTGKVPRLLLHSPEPRIHLHPRDAQRLQVAEGDLLEVSSASGSLLAVCQLESGQSRGEVFMPIHWNQQFCSHGLVNQLYPAKVDPLSGQPQSKWVEVALRPRPVSLWLEVCSLRPLPVTDFDYWVRVPLEQGWRYRLAWLQSGEDETGQFMSRLEDWLCRALGETRRINFSHSGTATWRSLHFRDDLLGAIVHAAPSLDRLPSQEVSAPWLGSPWGQACASLLKAGEGGGRLAGQVICACHRVERERIQAEIEAGADSCEALGARLGCGTRCGVCLPELQALLAARDQAQGDEGGIELQLPSGSMSS